MAVDSSNAATYLVVGASGTIGSAVARKLAGDGVVLGLHYCSNRAAVERLQTALEATGTRCMPIGSTLDSEEACLRMAEQVVAEIGVPDGIALCSGRVPWRAWDDVSIVDWQNVMFEHCIAPFTLMRPLVQRMQERGHGRLVYLSSIASKYGGSPRTLHYAASKRALETAMYGLSRITAKASVRINGVRAGFVDSPQQRAGRSPREIADRIEKIPMGRGANPEEVAAAVAFLLMPDSSFITGEILTVAGGD